MPGHDIVVLGASAGGVETLSRLVTTLPPDLPASLFVALHTTPTAPGHLPEILQRKGALPAVYPKDGDPFAPGHIYIAPPDLHLLVDRDQMRVVRGPKENRNRPAVDPLFRSAAWAFGPRVVGVVLSGTLDDGAAGLWAVKACGGTTIAQEPSDAPFGQMPATAMSRVPIDHVEPVERIGPLLNDLARREVVAADYSNPPPEVTKEKEFSMSSRDVEDMTKLGSPAPFVCPSCSGALWEIQNGDLIRYRCHVGHAYSPENLLLEQAGAIEGALYSALRALEEKAGMQRRMAEKYFEELPHYRAEYERRAAEANASADVIRQLLESQKH